jgi:hypothetical protein
LQILKSLVQRYFYFPTVSGAHDLCSNNSDVFHNIYEFLYTYIYINVCICTHLCIYIYVCVCVCVCMYVFMCDGETQVEDTTP